MEQKFYVATVIRDVHASDVKTTSSDPMPDFYHLWGHVGADGIWFKRGQEVHVTEWSGGRWFVASKGNLMVSVSVAAAKKHFRTLRINGRAVNSVVGPELLDYYRYQMSR